MIVAAGPSPHDPYAVDLVASLPDIADGLRAQLLAREQEVPDGVSV